SRGQRTRGARRRRVVPVALATLATKPFTPRERRVTWTGAGAGSGPAPEPALNSSQRPSWNAWTASANRSGSPPTSGWLSRTHRRYAALSRLPVMPSDAGPTTRMPAHPHRSDQRDEHGRSSYLKDVPDPVDPRGVADVDGGRDVVADDGADDPDDDREPQGNGLTATYHEFGQEADDQSGDDGPEDVHDFSLLRVGCCCWRKCLTGCG